MMIVEIVVEMIAMTTGVVMIGTKTSVIIGVTIAMMTNAKAVVTMEKMTVAKAVATTEMRTNETTVVTTEMTTSETVVATTEKDVVVIGATKRRMISEIVTAAAMPDKVHELVIEVMMMVDVE